MNWSRFRLSGLAACLGLIASTWNVAMAGAVVPVEQAEVVAVLPHDPTSFTEGLFFQDGSLFESTGRVGHSVIRKVALDTGKVLAESVLPDGYFGEGIVAWHDRLISLTWRSGKGFIWSYPGLARIGGFSYLGEGWGLTHDDRTLIMSDGTPCLRRLDPVTLHVLAKLCVTAGGVPVRRLNELEYIHGEIWANIWMTPEIARIDPVTGEVKSWLDLTALQENINSFDPDAVANGIAFDRKNDRIFVTGKYWPRLYQIKFPDRKH
ncbi:glutaminyl-peptide cyclotransferase [Asaia spathodeae]|uniref:Glutaminyl-peptide cyclotransferase n=1 Tax=Asaia spathodeae TaxID=657016 RepID=A0ABX2P701_9PROT|nr:glutaminyl-peptide cyclotransferase [Asaia spathodeae]GBR12697.1 glutamine cyclotransferase [Asaia spathodeae NBRC 105894]